MGLLSLYSVMAARRNVVLFAIAVAAALALGVGVLLPKTYHSTARVQVDSLKENLLTGLYEPRVRVNEFLGQQTAIASSRNVALRVYDTLTQSGFLQSEAFIAEWREKTGGESVPGNDARLWAADQLLRRLDVSANALESTIGVTWRSNDPSEAARVANAFANAYMETILDKRKRRAERNAARFDDETRSLARGLEVAQRDLKDFRSEAGIVGLGAQRMEDIEVELAALTMRLAEARTNYSEAQSLMRQARAALDGDLLTLPLPDEIEAGRQAQARLGAVQLRAQRLAERFGPTYPPLVEARNEKRALERTILQSVEDHLEFTQARVDALQGAARETKTNVVELQETKQNYDTLQRKLEANRETFDLVSTRSLQQSLQSRVDVVETLMLARAVPADRPSTPPIPVIVLLGAAVGLFLGATLAVALEFVDGRVRDPKMLARALRADLVAELSPPKRTARRHAA